MRKPATETGAGKSLQSAEGGPRSTVRELVVGSGLEFAERGVHTLKGAPGEWHLFAVNGTGTG